MIPKPLLPGYKEPYKETIANMVSAYSKFSSTYLFYLHILSKCEVIFDTTLEAPAAMNFQYDHYCIYINPYDIEIKSNITNNYFKNTEKDEVILIKGFNSYPLEQRLGILKHEILHILHNHIGRRENRDPYLFNIAADCAINQQIIKEHLPEDAIFPDNLPINTKQKIEYNLTTEQYYDLLNLNSNLNSYKNNYFSINASHMKWNESQGDMELAKDIAKNIIEYAIEETQKSKGILPKDINKLLNLLSNNQKEVDWHKILRKFIGNKSYSIKRTYKRVDRRQPEAIHIKGRIKDRICEVAIIGDESGSVSDKELTQALTECHNICKMLNTSIWYCPVDAEAHLPYLLKTTTRSFIRTACGGTNLTPALDMLQKHHISYDVLIIITDGHIDDKDIEYFATVKCPIIWLITKEGKIPSEIKKYLNMYTFKLRN